MMTAQVIEIAHKLRALWIGGPPGTSGYEPTRKRLFDLGIEVTSKVDRFLGNSHIPTGTHVVLLNTAFCDHMSQEAAKAEADKRGIPMVRINSQSWPRTLDAILKVSLEMDSVKDAALRARSPSSPSPMPRPSETVDLLTRSLPVASDKGRWNEADREERKRVAEDLLYLGAKTTSIVPGHFKMVPLHLRDRMNEEIARLTEAVEEEPEAAPPEAPVRSKDVSAGTTGDDAPGTPQAAPPPPNPEPPRRPLLTAPPPPPPAPAAPASPLERLGAAVASIDAEVAHLTATIEEAMARLSGLSEKREKVAAAERAMREAMALVDDLDVVDMPFSAPLKPAPPAAQAPAPVSASEEPPTRGSAVGQAWVQAEQAKPVTARKFYRDAVVELLTDAEGKRRAGPVLKAAVEAMCKAAGRQFGSSSFYAELQALAEFDRVIVRHGSHGSFSYSLAKTPAEG